MFEMSESIKELATALSKAQARIKGAVKASDNPELGTRYADLAAVWAACREALTRNGLSVVQFPGEMTGHCMAMTTMLMHASGQWVRQSLSIPLAGLDAQGYGAATTYARRYALAAVVGVCPEDDDGIAACEPTRLSGMLVPLPSGPISEEQLAELTDLALKAEADLEALCLYLNVPSLSALPARQYQAAVSALEQKRQYRRRAA